MLVQLLLGSLLILATVAVASAAWLVLELALTRLQAWFLRPPRSLRLVALVALAVLWTLVIMTACVWIWGFAYLALGIFGDLEAAVYFSLVAFTTLGFGDVLLSQDWRLLAGLQAANGLVIFGALTAMLVEALRNLRLRQRGGGRS